MANLSIPEITKDERVEYRSTLLVEKVFKKNNLENNFMTDKGLFHATSILIDGREYTTYAPDLDKTIIGLKGTQLSNSILYFFSVGLFLEHFCLNICK